jgi:hypothetical protein
MMVSPVVSDRVPKVHPSNIPLDRQLSNECMALIILRSHTQHLTLVSVA